MIKVEKLYKNFGDKVAVDGVSFTVKKGEVLGFLGPNGAGKSTTMRMITGFIPSVSGEVYVDGNKFSDDEVLAKSKIGYLPESAPLYSDMTVEGFLVFCARMREVPEEKVQEAVDKAIKTTFLTPVRKQSVDTLSKGYRHRTCFAQSIIHDPDILILDEPTDGLDPNQKHEIRQLIQRMGKTKAIIFSTHILEEVEAACTRAIVIDRGKVIADGKPDDLKAKSHKAGSVVLNVSGLKGEDIKKGLTNLGQVDSLEEVKLEEDGLVARIIPKDGKKDDFGLTISEFCVDKKLKIKELRVDEGRLDELFREITKTDADK